MSAEQDLRVSTWKIQAIAWVGAIFFSFCATMSWVSGQGSVSPWFIPFILLSLPILLLTGPVTASPRSLSVAAPLGRFQIAWQEVDRIEIGQSSIVFFAGRKRMSIPTPGFWSGAHREALLAAVNAIIKEREIEMRQTFRADFLLPKHAKVASHEH